MKTLTQIFLSVFIALQFTSCKNDSPTSVQEPKLLFDTLGLIDSAVVHQCQPLLKRYFVPDTLSLTEYSKLKFEFDGYANSDGSYIKVLFNTDTSSFTEIYSVQNIIEVNKLHSFEVAKPNNRISVEMRIYINPPIWQGEFKYTRARDLRIYGIR